MTTRCLTSSCSRQQLEWPHEELLGDRCSAYWHRHERECAGAASPAPPVALSSSSATNDNNSIDANETRCHWRAGS
jgi:hypothetical protein